MVDLQEERGARVRLPPPLVYLLSIIVGLVAQYVALPLRLGVPFVVRITAGAIVAAAGLLLGGSAFGLLRKTGQDPTPWKPTPSLVFAGPYRFTRNPMYVGMTAMQVGIAGGPRKRVRAELQVGRPVIAPFRDVQLCKALHIWRLPQP